MIGRLGETVLWQHRQFADAAICFSNDGIASGRLLNIRLDFLNNVQ